MSSHSINVLLDKMTSSDKDFRFMACNDLINELQKDEFKLDADSESKVVKMLLKLVDDANGEVQNLVVKCLTFLARRVRDNHLEELTDRLCSNVLSEKEQLRDISGIGLKNVIAEIPTTLPVGVSISKNLVTRLLKAIGKEDPAAQQSSLDILADVLSRFGPQLSALHGAIHDALVPLLTSSRPPIRKRAITAIGHLVSVVPDQQFSGLVSLLSERLEGKKPNVSELKTYIQCIATISRHAGSRLDKRLDRIIPRVIGFCTSEKDDELREFCFQALESFVYRCPKELAAEVTRVIELCLQFIQYDPNYNYDDDDESDQPQKSKRGSAMDTGDDNDDDNDNGDDDEDDDDNGDDDDEDDDAYSDDEDVSWKVRRSAAKCLSAIVVTRPDLLGQMYKAVTPTLIARFKEREQTVQVEIFAVYAGILRNTKIVASQEEANKASASMEVSESGPVASLRGEIPSLVNALRKQLKAKDVRTRQGCIGLLRDLVNAIPSALVNSLGGVIPGIKFALTDKSASSNLKIDTLQFLASLFASHPPEPFQAFIDTLTPLIIAPIKDSFYKVVSEALSVATLFVHVLRPSVDTPPAFAGQASALNDVVLSRLSASDSDQEVKERSIICTGHLVSVFGDVFAAELPRVLSILLERIRNESTRLSAVRTFARIASSPLNVDLQPVILDLVKELAGFLRKNNRALRLVTLEALVSLFEKYSFALGVAQYSAVFAEARALILDSDLHVAQLAIHSATTVVASVSQMGASDSSAMASTSTTQVVAAAYDQGVADAVYALLRSPMLQGGALDACLAFFRAVVVSGEPRANYRKVIETLIRPIYMENVPGGSKLTISGQQSQTTPRQAFYSVSKCVGAVCHAQPEEYVAIASQFTADVDNKETTDNIKLLALLCIGEIGRYHSLSSLPNLPEIIISQFSAVSEDLKSAASYSLGTVSVGNLPLYLPFVLEQISTQPKRQYLLFHSLKEIISSQSFNADSAAVLQPYILQIWELLFGHSESKEEGTRNVVAECLGRLTLLNPESCFADLESRLASPSAFTRATVVSAVKYTISDHATPIDALLRPRIGLFLGLIQDSDLNVRRVALVALNSAAHNKPVLVRDLLGDLLPSLYIETKIKPELIRVVEMGPFKHTVDDGLDLRKAAFECMYTLLDSCLDRIDLYEFLGHVIGGLKDQYDIKALCHLIIVRLTLSSSTVVLQRVDELVDPLRATITAAVKPNAVKQEIEKNDEMVRSALRAIAALVKIPDAAATGKFGAFLNEINADATLKGKFIAVVKESESQRHGDAMDLSM